MTSSFRHGPEVLKDGGVQFSLWSPDAKSVDLLIEGQAPVPMPEIRDGWKQIIIPTAKVGTLYSFRLNGDDNLIVPDFGSHFQPQGIPGPSEVIDFKKLPSEPLFKRPSWADVRIYQLHVGAFSPDGTYEGVESKLDHLKYLGVNALQLMPLHEIPGERSWGYDIILPYAPTHTYGRPEDLKRFINAAHAKGIMVFFDVVHNHFGPDQNMTIHYARAFTEGKTPWGEGPNYKEPAIRAHLIQHTLDMFEHYGADGIRFDACHSIFDDASDIHILHELQEAVRTTYPADNQPFLIQENDKNETRFLEHGWNAVWAGDAHNALRALWLDANHHYYKDYADKPLSHFCRALAEGYSYQGQISTNQSTEKNTVKRGEPSAHVAPEKFILFFENHDQIGNSASNQRLMNKLFFDQENQLTDILSLSPHTPMYFMGQLEGGTTKFRYFTDQKGELAELVKRGRRTEFEHDPDFDGHTPDPSDPDSFYESKIKWQEFEEPENKLKSARAHERHKIREKHLIPLIKKDLALVRQEILGRRQGVALRWQTSEGGEWEIIANLSSAAIAMPSFFEGDVVWRSKPDISKNILEPNQSLFIVRQGSALTKLIL